MRPCVANCCIASAQNATKKIFAIIRRPQSHGRTFAFEFNRRVDTHQPTNNLTTSPMKQKLPPETWRMIIQIAITILTALSGMFAEAQTQNIAMLLH